MLSPEAIKKIDYELTKYPEDQTSGSSDECFAYCAGGTRLACLKKVFQTLPTIYVSQKLRQWKWPVSIICTTYSPVGQYTRLAVCTNISCMLRDSDAIVEHLQN